MKKLFTILSFLISFCISAQTVAFSFTKQPVSISNARPGAGATFWQAARSVNTIASVDHYFRCNWAQVQSAHATFNWSVLDAQINAAIALNDGSKMIIRIVGVDEGYGGNVIAGSNCSYPAFLHTLMQTESVKDWVYGPNNQWVPNYNSTHWVGELDNMFLTLNDHLNNTSSGGVPYSSVILGIDMMGFGDYFEWHNFGSGWNGTTWAGPAGTQATDATQIAIIQSNLSRFPNYQLYAHISMIYGDESGNSVGAFALAASNNVGPVGFRSDHMGDGNVFGFEQNKMNQRTVNGINFKTAYLNQWMIAPMTGEIIQPGNGSTNGGANCHGYNLPTEVLTYHDAFFSNDNIDNTQACQVANLTTASNTSGYSIRPQSGSMSDSIRPSGTMTISLSYINEGVSPTYEKWNVTYELRQSGVVKFVFNSSFQPRLFLPGVINITDNIALGNTFSGNYDLYVVARDPNGYRKPLPYQITGRGADGAYLLRSGIAIAVTGPPPPPPPPPPPNNPPIVYAGGNFTDSLSIRNFDTLKGIASDPDGDPLTFSWAQTSGPNTAGMATPTQLQNIISGLVAGIYRFRLTANDGRGGISTSDVLDTVINVTAPPPPPPPPPVYLPPTVVILKGDTTIQAPADSIILSVHVTHKDTAIQSAHWLMSVGSTGTIVSVNDSTTRVTGLQPIGNTIQIYQFYYVITDKAGNVTSNQSSPVTVRVLPLIVPPPPPPPPIIGPKKYIPYKAF